MFEGVVKCSCGEIDFCNESGGFVTISVEEIAGGMLKSIFCGFVMDNCGEVLV